MKRISLFFFFYLANITEDVEIVISEPGFSFAAIDVHVVPGVH